MAWLESWNLQRTFQVQTGDCHLGVHSAQRLHSEFENMGSSRLCSVCRRFGWHATQLLATMDGQRGERASKRRWRHSVQQSWHGPGAGCVFLWLGSGSQKVLHLPLRGPLARVGVSPGVRPPVRSRQSIRPGAPWTGHSFFVRVLCFFLPFPPKLIPTWIRYVPCLPCLQVESRVSPCLPCACSVAPRWLSHPPVPFPPWLQSEVYCIWPSSPPFCLRHPVPSYLPSTTCPLDKDGLFALQLARLEARKATTKPA